MTTDRDLLLEFNKWLDDHNAGVDVADVDAFLASRSPAAAVSADGKAAGKSEEYPLLAGRSGGQTLRGGPAAAVSTDGETDHCAPGCRGIEIGDGNCSGCACGEGEELGFPCDCPQHPAPFVEVTEVDGYMEACGDCQYADTLFITGPEETMEVGLDRFIPDAAERDPENGFPLHMRSKPEPSRGPCGHWRITVEFTPSGEGGK